MAAANMDESILSFDQDGFFGSSVLVPMGIKINKPHMEVKLKDVIRRFNDIYLETMDFLTQILPLAREQFGRSDNLLLPKTPSKKRHRKMVQDLCNQENVSPNILAHAHEDDPPPVKRITRNSKRNNPSQTFKEPVKTRTTRSRAKKSEPKSEQSKVTFVDNSETKITIDSIELSSEKKTSVSKSKNLKRTSSTSPLSTKPIKKKSKSNDGISVSEDNLSGKQTSTPLSSEAPESLSLSLIVDEMTSNSEELINAAEKDETILFDLEGPEKRNDERMDVDIREESEPAKLVDIGDDNKAVKHSEVVLVLNTPPVALPAPTKVQIKPETSILVNINDTPDKIARKYSTESSVICKTPVSEVDQVVVNETPANEVVNKVPVDEIVNEVPANEVVNEVPANEVVNEPPANKVGNEVPANEVVNEVAMTPAKKTNKVANDVKDEQLETRTEITPVEVQPLRRSKRLTKQIVAEPVSNGLSEPELPKPMDESKHNKEEESSDSQDELSSKRVVSMTPESKPLRRSTRVSRRISKVSTGFVRRTSRRSSRRSSCFKKPQPAKRIGVNLVDVDRSRVTKSPLVGSNEVSSGAESTESEDEHSKTSGSVVRSNTTPRQQSKTDSSSSDEVAEACEGKVAGLVKKINGKNHDEQSSMCNTPTGLRNLKIKRLGSAVQGSSQRPPNLVGGNVKSFIKRQSVKKIDPSEVIRQRKLELQRKEEKDKERKDLAELRRKNWAEEQKRKREEKQKRVAEAKAAREREEQDKKQRQLEERKQILHATEQARKKREHEEETKKKLREQRTKEAEARRLKEKEERLKRLQEKEEEDKMYREMLKRKLEYEEQERKQRIQEEKRVNELKQRERVREKEEERERKLKEIKEREAKRIEKEEAEKKQKEETERREREEKERRQREQEDREKKRIAQLIKDKMDQEKKLHAQRLQKEEKERREREEQRKREVQRAAMLQAPKTADSYLMTPPPAQTRKPATTENYDISDIRSDESTDDEDAPRKKVPYWAQGAALKYALLQQEEPRRIFEDLASGFVPHAPDLEKIFTKKRKRFYQRTSSAHWNSPPIKV